MEIQIARSVPVVDHGMIRGLEAFYNVVSQEWREVRGECSEIAEQIARQFGLIYIEGSFRLDAPLTVGSLKFEEPHAWCVDGNRSVVDLTVEQFNPGLYTKVPKGALVIGEKDPLFIRYRPRKMLRF